MESRKREDCGEGNWSLGHLFKAVHTDVYTSLHVYHIYMFVYIEARNR